MNHEQWITAFAKQVGTEPPSSEQIEQLLKLASLAAHASERPAAPIACFIAGQAGLSPEQFFAAADRVSAQDA